MDVAQGSLHIHMFAQPARCLDGIRALILSGKERGDIIYVRVATLASGLSMASSLTLASLKYINGRGYFHLQELVE